MKRIFAEPGDTFSTLIWGHNFRTFHQLCPPFLHQDTRLGHECLFCLLAHNFEDIEGCDWRKDFFFWITNFGNTSFCLKWHPALGKGISWHVFFLCVFWLMDSACSSSPREQPQEGINTSSKGDHTGTSWDGYTTIHCRCTCCIGARFCLFYCWKWQLPPGCRGKAGIEYLTLGKCPPRKPIHTAF